MSYDIIIPVAFRDYIFLKKSKIIFIETRRPPIYAENKAEACIEVPAGLVGDEVNGETVIDAVKKELMEETGYSAEKIEIVVPLMSSSGGCTSETSAMAVADIYNDKIIKEPVTDGGIIIKRYKIPVSEAENWIKQQQEAKKCISAQALAALYFAKTH